MEGDPFPQSDPKLMEGRHAIFTEKWIVSYVRVHTIRVTDRAVHTRITPIPTQGLYGKFEIGIGCIREYLSLGKEIWVDRAYCRWCLVFAPQVIQEVLDIAASFPKDWIYHTADPHFDQYFQALYKPISEYEAREAPHPDFLYLKQHGVL